METIGNFGLEDNEERGHALYTDDDDEVIYNDNDLDDLSSNGDHEDPSSTYIGNAYLGQMARYKQLTSMVQSIGDNNDVSKLMDMAIVQLATKKASNQKRPTVAEGGTVGMIELEKRKTVKRLRPAGSPDRKKSR